MDNFKKVLEERFEFDWYDDEDETEVAYISYDQECAVTINKENNTFSIYRIFSYDDDYKREDFEDVKDTCLINVLWQNNHPNESMYVDEKAFQLFLSNNSEYLVESWDDGSYMCPGFVAHIGYYNINCDINVVDGFLNLVDDYGEKLKDYNSKRKFIIEEFNRKNKFVNNKENRKGFWIDIGVFSPEAIVGYNKIKDHYVGKEYFLFYCEGEEYSVPLQLYKVAAEYFENWEYDTELQYYTTGNELLVCNNFVYVIISANQPFSLRASSIEESFIVASINDFLPFSSQRLKSSFFDIYAKDITKIKNDNKNVPLIITEGATDWKHLKRAWNKIKEDPVLFDKYRDLEFNIFEYEPENSSDESQNKIQMDGSTLIAMCNSYSKMDNGVYIFIADRDVSSIVKTISSSKNEHFKSWGNNVFSFVLPVPKIRESSPDICIEHYYSDEEIKTSKIYPDGICRRLYLSNEFDEYGRAPDINRFCTNRSSCNNTEKLRIIDGSGSDKVILLNSINEKTNYAMSKMEFAKSIINGEENFTELSYKNFTLVFDIIKEIYNFIMKGSPEVESKKD